MSDTALNPFDPRVLPPEELPNKVMSFRSRRELTADLDATAMALVMAREEAAALEARALRAEKMTDVLAQALEFLQDCSAR